ncbi:hypothetical protein B0H65DRAFT_202227 [Neurospora tetraspora]|uniref:Uncharacterized protein n=1 Tax=Neurospora tetraspora TaxID=94610 RepID=A0AAE0JG20_9PEZI|nr:hypothetical protein B0H65DRAFT_202227 [Neurospora tetraspora]
MGTFHHLETRGIHSGYTTQYTTRTVSQQVRCVKRQTSKPSRVPWKCLGCVDSNSGYDHIRRLAEIADNRGHRHGETDSTRADMKLSELIVYRIGVALYPIFFVLFLRQAEAQRRSRTQLGPPTAGQRFEAHARTQGTPTLVFLVLGHSRARSSRPHSTPNTRR